MIRSPDYPNYRTFGSPCREVRITSRILRGAFRLDSISALRYYYCNDPDVC